MQNKLNVASRTIFCKDNLDIMQGINNNSIDLIYLDPPFNKNKIFTAPIGSSAEGASFSDIFREEDVKDEWVQTIKEDNHELYHFLSSIRDVGNHYNFCYLTYMAIRLIECQRILKETGSLYLHCDPTMSHYLKLLLDCVFGEDNFRNEIVWSYQGTGQSKRFFKRKHDIILFYSKTENCLFSDLGSSEEISDFSKSKFTKKDDTGLYKEIKHQDGKIYKQYRRNMQRMRDVWEISVINAMAKERTGYPTQKPLALLRRIIEASSNENDVVFDPFCGCATTCIAAEQLNRQWIGIDVSIKAFELVKQRLEKEVPVDMFRGEPNFSTSPPKRTDDGADMPLKKWVYVISNNQYQGEYKVGIAKDWQARLTAYQTSDPNRAYECEYKIETEKYRELEKYIHEKFENRREWVYANLDDIIKEMKLYIKL